MHVVDFSRLSTHPPQEPTNRSKSKSAKSRNDGDLMSYINRFRRERRVVLTGSTIRPQKRDPEPFSMQVTSIVNQEDSEPLIETIHPPIRKPDPHGDFFDSINGWQQHNEDDIVWKLLKQKNNPYNITTKEVKEQRPKSQRKKYTPLPPDPIDETCDKLNDVFLDDVSIRSLNSDDFIPKQFFEEPTERPAPTFVTEIYFPPETNRPKSTRAEKTLPRKKSAALVRPKTAAPTAFSGILMGKPYVDQKKPMTPNKKDSLPIIGEKVKNPPLSIPRPSLCILNGVNKSLKTNSGKREIKLAIQGNKHF